MISPFSAERRLRRLIRRTARSWTVDAQDGKLVRLIGNVELTGAPMQSPLSGRDCVYYVASLAEGERVTILERKGVDFFIRDGAGTAAIDVEGADVRLPDDLHFPSVSPRCAEFLRRHGRERAGVLIVGDGMLFRERIVAPGDRVAVFGFARRIPDAAASATYRATGTRVVVQRPLWLSKEKWAISD